MTWWRMTLRSYHNCTFRNIHDTVYPKKYAHGFCFAVLCCGHTLTDFPISTRITSLALWQSNDCPSAGKATLMIMDKYFMWNHYERLHNHNKAKHNKTACIFIGIYCIIRGKWMLIKCDLLWTDRVYHQINLLLYRNQPRKHNILSYGFIKQTFPQIFINNMIL